MYGRKAKRVDALYSRKGKNITTLADNSVESFKTVNLAKKASTRLQGANGGLGMGSLVLA